MSTSYHRHSPNIPAAETPAYREPGAKPRKPRGRGFKATPLDPAVERPEPLLVVKRPLSLYQVAHQYVASVFVECDGCHKAACKTLGISTEGLYEYIRRIEAGLPATGGIARIHPPQKPSKP